MTDPKHQEMQSELFTQFSPGEIKNPGRFPPVPKTHKPILLTTSVEQLILAGIGLILLSCFIFFLGVIRGKSIAPESSQGPPIRMTAPALAPLATKVSRSALTAPISAPAQTPASSVKSASAPSMKENPKKPYTIQLVTYKKSELAQKEVAGLRKAGYYSAVIPSGDYYLVCVGQYASIDDAKKDLRTFGARYKDCFLRRR